MLRDHYKKIEKLKNIQFAIQVLSMTSPSDKTFSNSLKLRRAVSKIKNEIKNVICIDRKNERILNQIDDLFPDFSGAKVISQSEIVDIFKSDKLWTTLNKEIKKAIDQIKKSPSNPEKTFEYFKSFGPKSDYHDGLLLLNSFIDQKYVAETHKHWRQELKYHRNEGHNIRWNDYIFWTSRDFQDLEDSISYYKFYELFPSKMFKATFDQVENNVARRLLEEFDGKNKPESGYTSKNGLIGLLWNFWVISRSQLLCQRLHDIVQLSIRSILNDQHKDGYWFYHDSKLNEVPSVSMTAFASNIILKLGASPEMRKAGIRAAKWLKKKQSKNGAWKRTNFGSKKLTHEDSTIVTIVAAEALERSGIRSNSKSIRLARKFINSTQEPMGTWHERAFLNNTYLQTAFVTEYLLGSGSFPTEINELQALARDYIFRAVGLIHDQDSQACRTAIMLSFESLEMFFYSILNHCSGSTSFTKKNGFTIGLDSASSKIFAELSLKGIIVAPHPRHGEIPQLKMLRNEIVHRGGKVNKKDALDKVNLVFSFISYYSKLSFGYDLTK